MEKYIVEDIIGTSCNRLYVLESPHETEVQTGIPASGPTGTIMSEVLYKNTTPLGMAINNKEIKDAGIINACQFPLDSRPYMTIPNEILEYLNIKKLKYTQTQYKEDIKEFLNEIDKLNTVSNFRQRLEKVVSEKSIGEIVICGFISQAYFEMAFPNIGDVKFKTWSNINIKGTKVAFRYTHHPSPRRESNNWRI